MRWSGPRYGGRTFFVRESRSDVLLDHPASTSSKDALCRFGWECVSFALVGMWLSLVERCVRDAEVVGSNPAIPTR